MLISTHCKIYQQYMEFEGDSSADQYSNGGLHSSGFQANMPGMATPNFNFGSGFIPPMGVNGGALSFMPPPIFSTGSGYGFNMPIGEENAGQYYSHNEGGVDEVTEQDIKMNEYLLHIRPEKLLVYHNHLFNLMQPKKTQIDINLENLPAGIHYTHIIEFFKFNGVPTEPKQVYIKIRGPKKDKCTINCYNNYELAWKFVNLFGCKFSGKWLNLELPDYEKSHKPRSNTFDEFWKEFDQRMALEKQNAPPVYGQPQTAPPAVRKESVSVSPCFFLSVLKPAFWGYFIMKSIENIKNARGSEGENPRGG